MASEGKVKILIKGHITYGHSYASLYLKKILSLLAQGRLSHLWHMTIEANDKPLFISDGALNVLPRIGRENAYS